MVYLRGVDLFFQGMYLRKKISTTKTVRNQEFCHNKSWVNYIISFNNI